LNQREAQVASTGGGSSIENDELPELCTPTAWHVNALRFQPEVPYYTIGDGQPFGVELIQRALFESTYLNPTILPLETDLCRHLPIVVSCVRLVYEPCGIDEHRRASTTYWRRDWLVRGWVLKTPDDERQEFTWVNAYFVMDSGACEFERVDLQLIRDGIDGPRPW
jgi:hypothetical protein